MRLLVTGVAGFVGRALIACPGAKNYSLCLALRVKANFVAFETVLTGDIGPETSWEAALQGVSCIVHLAARTHVARETASDPLAEYRKVNVAGTERLASEAARAGVRRFVYLSSIKVNGEKFPLTPLCKWGSRPFTESDAPNPQDAYGITKWEAEQALHRIGRETGMEIVILRPPLVYGPHVKGNFLSLLKAVDRGWPLPFRSIRNARSLIYVGNLVDAIMRCIAHPKAAGQTFLVSDGEDVSTPELVERIAKGLDRPLRLVPLPPVLLNTAASFIGKKGAAARLTGSFQVDSSKIRGELEWTRPYSMAEGLAATCSWYLDTCS
ncbi:MAG: UDP-glucose 4-epimerase family protein [Burkholderiales bacterium]